jgi:hypothetical protein
MEETARGGMLALKRSQRRVRAHGLQGKVVSFPEVSLSILRTVRAAFFGRRNNAKNIKKQEGMT